MKVYFPAYCMKQYQCGIFDHSGVLSDDRRPVYEADALILVRYGITPSSFEEWLTMTNASAGEALIARGIPVSKKEIDELHAQFYREVTTREANPTKPIMYPDAPEVLQALRDRGLKLAVVSSHPAASLRQELAEYGLSDNFDIVSGDPSPKARRLVDVCFDLQIPVGAAFFVGDTIYDLKAGYLAGVDCFGITTGYHPRQRLEAERKAVRVVDSLTELLQLV